MVADAPRRRARPGRARGPVGIELPAGRLGEHALRAALAAAAAIGRTVRVSGVRASERPAGLRRRDLAAIEAVRRVARARVSGASIGSDAFELRPGAVLAGEHRVALGNGAPVAGIVTMLAPALARADAPSILHVSGATHAPDAPSSDALGAAWCPLASLAGPALSLETLRHGFPPVGGGEVRLTVSPAPFAALHLRPDASDPALRAICTIAGLPDDVARRELDPLAALPGLGDEAARTVRRVAAERPGNTLALEARFASHVELLEVHGREGLPAERVARELAALWARCVRRGDALGPDLVAELVLPLALGAGGTLRSRAPGGVVRTVAEVAHAFGLGPIEWVADASDGAPSERAESPTGTLRIGSPEG